MVTDVFTDRTVIVTGATSGIGRGAALGFHEAGMRVIALGRNLEALSAERERCPRLSSVYCDVSEPDSVDAAFARIADEVGAIDYALNAAGVSGPGDMASLSADVLHATYSVNVVGLLLCMQRERELMHGGGGSIVNLTSVHAHHLVFNGIGAYASSKAAAAMLTRAAAVEWAPDNIRVNAIAPGPISSPMLDKSEQDFGAATQWRNITPNQRIGSVDDTTHTAMYLFSEWSHHVTGHELTVDGGFAAV